MQNKFVLLLKSIIILKHLKQKVNFIVELQNQLKVDTYNYNAITLVEKTTALMKI